MSSSHKAVFEKYSLVCPSCKQPLANKTQNELACENPACLKSFPIEKGIPLLINEDFSVFKISDMQNKMDIYTRKRAGATTETKLINIVKKFIPELDLNLAAEKNIPDFFKKIASQNRPARVLVVGGGTISHGLQNELENSEVDIVETDVTFGPRSAILCDAHDIPFPDEYFDGVIAQAVMEHVVNPQRCAKEIFRVLKPKGLVYSETPFMQQVHMGQYDFTRFTHLGHRRLFRRFEEIKSGVLCGPAMALSWSIKYFFLSFLNNRALRLVATGVLNTLLFPLLFFDYFLKSKPGSYDSASGFYFMGFKSDKVLPDRELLKGYQGRFRL